jgi:steroid delta-isomerase-like uncharacterized protein
MNSPTTGTDPETLVRRWFEELFNRADPSVADEILAETVAYHGPPSLSPGDVTGPEEIKEYVEVYKTAFPDLVYAVEELSATDGEVRVRWSATGTQESDLFGMDPTGEMFSAEGISVFVVEGGEITEVYAQWDTLQMVQDLGVVPPVGLAADSSTDERDEES